MITIRKRSLVALGTAGVFLVGAGAAAAAVHKGPPASAPRLAQQAGMVAGGGYGLRLGEVAMDAAADYLGLDETALMTARHAGSSLAQIAADQGKTVAGLEQAMTTAFKANLDKLVAAGTLTDAQAQQVLARFTANLRTTVERTATGPQFGRGGGLGLGLGMGYGFGGGR